MDQDKFIQAVTQYLSGKWEDCDRKRLDARILALGVVLVCDMSGDFDAYFDRSRWRDHTEDVERSAQSEPRLMNAGLGSTSFELGTNFIAAGALAKSYLKPIANDSWLEKPTPIRITLKTPSITRS